MGLRDYQATFGGGEVSPEFFGRIDDPIYQGGLATCRNFWVKPGGMIENRAGLRYVRTTRDSTQLSRVIPFTYNTTQTMVIELGALSVRFHTAGAALLCPAGPAWRGNNATVTISNATPAVVTWAAHGLAAGDKVLFTTTGTLPAPLAPNTAYYVSATGLVAGSFQISLTAGGASIATTTAGSGVHTGWLCYLPGDLVSSAGTNYYCTTFNANNVPPNATYWYAEPATGEYEIPSPYAAADLNAIHYTQSADVMTLVHPTYPPMELRRLGATTWTLIVPLFQSSQIAPTGVAAVATGAGTIVYKYVVTAVGNLLTDESLPSTFATCTGNLFTTGNFNTITWNASVGAVRYQVYKFNGGLYGYIGQADSSLSFVDNNIAADLSHTPPNSINPFVGVGNYPAAVGYVEQRRVFGGSNLALQNVWATKSGTESNMNYSLPIRDDDSIQFRVAAREACSIRHIVPLIDMLLLTSSTEWRVNNPVGGPLTPSTVNAKPQGYVGANNAQPVVVANSVVFAAARGGRPHEMSFVYQAGGYVASDLSYRVTHLFEGANIVGTIGFAKLPYPIIYFVDFSSGQLRGLTYAPQQGIRAWHKHDTQNGIFESCCVVAEGTSDIAYFIVNRTINGSVVRYVECFHTRLTTAAQQDQFFVDCGVTYSGAPATVISGLTWLEGQTVSVLGDGGVLPQCVVTGGAITLQSAVSVAQIGLQITADAQTLPVVVDGPGFAQGHKKNVNRVYLKVFRSSGFFAGPDASNLVQVEQRTNENYGVPPALTTDEVQIDIKPSWNNGGQVFIRQTDPLPLTLLGIEADVTVGG